VIILLQTSRNKFYKPEGTDYIDITYLTANWDAIDVMVAKHNLNAATAPTVNDDSEDDYSIGSLWYDLANNNIYTAFDVTVGAAVWIKIYPADTSIYATVASLASYAKLDGSNSFTAGLTLAQIATPAEPSANYTKVYAKNDGLLYYIVNGGSETKVYDSAHTHAYIAHSLATAANDFLVASGSGTFVKKTLAETKAILEASYIWQTMPGTPTRISDTQFTITDTSNTNKYDKIFTKGTILQWLESTTFCTAMVISASYDTNTVTINIVGDSLSNGFTTMKYCIYRAQKMEWIIPGYIGVATDQGRTHYADYDLIKLSVDVRIKTAGATNATTIDINDDGNTIITTKPSISGTGTSDLDNVCDAPTTVIAKDSVLTIDVDAVTTTAPQDLYAVLFYYPESWRYLS